MARARLGLLTLVAVVLAACAAPLTFAASDAPGASTTTTTTTAGTDPARDASAACVQSPPLAPDTTPPPAPDAAAAQPSPTKLAQIQAIQSQTQQVRGLPQAAAPVLVIPSGQVNPTIEALKTQRDRENASKIDPLAKQIGWVAESSTVELEMDKLRQGLILGFYVPVADTLWVVERSEVEADATMSPLQQATLSHEWVHALQDASYDLQHFDDEAGQYDLDRTSAMSALFEGDAVFFEEEWMSQFLTSEQRSQKEQEELGIGLPQDLELGPLVADLLMPYTHGPEFVRAVLESSGSPPLTSVYARPPRTTAEILHPELYLQGFTPADVELPDVGAALGSGWQQTMGGTWGEYSSANLVAGLNALPTADAELPNVEGWQGDCLGFWQAGEGRFGAIATQWVDAPSARRFADRFEAALAKAGATAAPGGFSSLDAAHLWKVGVDGDRTVVLFTNSEEAAAATGVLAAGASGRDGGSAL